MIKLGDTTSEGHETVACKCAGVLTVTPQVMITAGLADAADIVNEEARPRVHHNCRALVWADAESELGVGAVFEHELAIASEGHSPARGRVPLAEELEPRAIAELNLGELVPRPQRLRRRSGHAAALADVEDRV